MKRPALSFAEMRRRIFNGVLPAPASAAKPARAQPAVPVETAAQLVDRKVAERRRLNEAAEAARLNAEVDAAKAKAGSIRASWRKALAREPEADAAKAKAGHRDAWKRALGRREELPASETQADPRGAVRSRKEPWG